MHVLGSVSGRDKWALLRDADVTVHVLRFGKLRHDRRRVARGRRPAVVTRTCPWPEIETRDAASGSSRTRPAIAAALRALADDPARRRRMGERGAAFARERYGWDAIAPVMSRLYAGLM